jgi:hypothetical protein
LGLISFGLQIEHLCVQAVLFDQIRVIACFDQVPREWLDRRFMKKTFLPPGFTRKSGSSIPCPGSYEDCNHSRNEKTVLVINPKILIIIIRTTNTEKGRENLGLFLYDPLEFPQNMLNFVTSQ